MKKKSCITLALTLILMQIFTMVAAIPAFAADRSYDVNQVAAAPAVDGTVDSVWDNFAWSESFNMDSATGGFTNPNMDVKFKALWMPAADNKMDLYVLVQGTGYTAAMPNLDGVRILLSDGTTISYTDFARLDAAGGNKVGTNITYANFKHGTYTWYLGVANNTFVCEFTCQLDMADSVLLDFHIYDGNSWSAIGDYSWNGGGVSKKPAGVCNIVKNAVEIDPFDYITVSSTTGASIRLDTADTSKSGIRFATTVSVPEGVTIKKTGTLLIPTTKLADTEFTKEALVAAGLVEGTDFYDLENVGNGWVDGGEGGLGGTWYGTIYNIKSENFERKISGIGYAVVEVDGEEYTVYAQYDSSKNARSIKQIAAAALVMLDEGGNLVYQEGTLEYALLKSFTTAG